MAYKLEEPFQVYFFFKSSWTWIDNWKETLDCGILEGEFGADSPIAQIKGQLFLLCEIVRFGAHNFLLFFQIFVVKISAL